MIWVFYNNKNVRILERALKIKSGPQTITISTKHFDKDTSESMFRSISKLLVKISENLNKVGIIVYSYNKFQQNL